MKKYTGICLLLIGGFLAGNRGWAVDAVQASSAMALQSSPQPQDFMQQVTNELLLKIVEERPHYKKDPQVLYHIVDENITPYVDFPMVARRVMGQFYRQASDAQRQRFVGVFKNSLVRTYGNGLSAYDHQTINILPGRGPQKGKTATVQMEIVSSSGESIPVTYELQRNAAGAWMLENVVLNGINLGLTFRNQFTSDMEQYRNNIDSVIDHWVPEAPKVHQP